MTEAGGTSSGGVAEMAAGSSSSTLDGVRALVRCCLRRTVTAADFVAAFPETWLNRLDLKVGGHEFWPALLADLTAARSSIHMNVFGVEADAAAWQLAGILAERARQGLRVRIVVDRWGAGLSSVHRWAAWLTGRWPPVQELFDFCQQNGVEVVFYGRLSRVWNGEAVRNLLDLYHFDHRKFYVIDGRVAYIGGYTVQNHQLTRMYDAMVRLEGEVVWQLQSAFLASFVYNGGMLEAQSESHLVSTYFPHADVAGHARAAILMNVPERGRSVTEAYLAEMRAARDYLYVMGPYVSDNRMVARMKAAARRGVKVCLLIPQRPENPLNSLNCRYHCQDLIAAGVAVYEYVGERALGRLHGKALVRDDEFATVGSCNLDTLALEYNFEANLVSRDRMFVQEVRRRLFEAAFRVSRKVERLDCPWRRSLLEIAGRLTELLDAVD